MITVRLGIKNLEAVIDNAWVHRPDTRSITMVNLVEVPTPVGVGRD